MKRTIKISLGRYAFTLDEEAFKLLQAYLEKLQQHYTQQPSGKEIVDSIEEHVAELLLDRGYKDKVVDRPILVEIIQLMGEPEDIDSGLNEGQPKSLRKKKLYRNPERSIVGGVCGGLSVFFGWDVVIFRLIFLLFPILYFLLWIIVPEARTFEQKCEMYGSSGSIPDIERDIQKGKLYPPHNQDDPYSFLHRIIRIVKLLLGIGLLMGGLSLFILLIGLYISLHSMGLPIHELCLSFGIEQTEVLLLINLALWGVLLFYWSIRLIFNLKVPKWKPGFWCLILIFLTGISTTVSLVSQIVLPLQHTSSNYPDCIRMEAPASDTLHIVLVDPPTDSPADREYAVEANTNYYDCAYLDPTPKNFRWVLFPEIRVTTKNSIDDLEMREIYQYARLKKHQTMQEPNKSMLTERSGDTLYVHPYFFERLDNLEILDAELQIAAPKNSIIVVENPIRYEFRNAEGRRLSLENHRLGWI